MWLDAMLAWTGYKGDVRDVNVSMFPSYPVLYAKLAQEDNKSKNACQWTHVFLKYYYSMPQTDI